MFVNKYFIRQREELRKYFLKKHCIFFIANDLKISSKNGQAIQRFIFKILIYHYVQIKINVIIVITVSIKLSHNEQTIVSRNKTKNNYRKIKLIELRNKINSRKLIIVRNKTNS